MKKLWIKTENWQDVLMHIIGTDTIHFLGTETEYADYDCTTPKMKKNREHYQIAEQKRTRFEWKSIEMVGNGTLLENRVYAEVGLSDPLEIRLISIGKQAGLFIEPDTPKIREILAKWKPKMREQPEIEKPMFSNLDLRKSPNRRITSSSKYECPVDHRHEVERDPIGDAYICVECGREIS